jgi:hypothetical protein
MNYAYALGAFAVLYYLYKQFRANQILADLKRKDRTEAIKEIARLTSEIENAKLNYANSRAEYDAITGESDDAKLFDDGNDPLG